MVSEISGSIDILSLPIFFPGAVMSKQCEVCGKKPTYGNSVSHANNLTRRRWEPNLQRVRAVVEGTRKRVRICTDCLRSGRVTKAV
jgi:large subunit ribosomal protein L28